ncbi:MAG: excinuclease ABC subunit UvrC [Flavobacteriaceae bacterium]
MDNIGIKIQLTTIPETPGVYQFYDSDEKVIYVGKAKNLKKRVKSYFTKKHDDAKTSLLVKKITNIKYVIVESETDALLLENNLIKKYQPKYNVLLKDDKSYPWVCIKNERFPRVFITRRVIKDGSEYFGPYSNVKVANTIISLIKSIYPIRIESYNFSQRQINNPDEEIFLKTHSHKGNFLVLGFSKKPKLMTSDYINEKQYKTNISFVKQILNGKLGEIKKNLRDEMLKFSNQNKFEEAQSFKEKIIILENYQSKSTIVNPNINNVEVYTIISDESYAYVNFLQLSHGSIIRAHTLEMKKKLKESDKELLLLAITEIRQRFELKTNEIFLPFKLDLPSNFKVSVPKVGDKKHLIDLSLRNAKYHRLEKLKQVKITDPDRHVKRIMTQMKSDLRLKEIPTHIECFDNSNIQGTNPVAACVVFKNGRPSKKDYRHFNIKSVEGPDDYASMEEVVFRRYKRLLDEQKPLPQLIIIDGGKGQLSAALKSLDLLELRSKIAILGIAKRLEELFYPNDPIPLYLDKKSETLKIIQQLRNEAHRFGIEHHRNRRSKSALISELETVSGIGEKTRVQLLKAFKSVQRVSYAKIDELEQVIGKSKALKVYNYFNSKNESKI